MGIDSFQIQDAEAAIPDSYEAALAELEQLVAYMESGELTLEQSLMAYQRGVVLSRACQQRLEKAEQQVKVLQEQLLRPFNEADEL
ncbi:MAG TPA: exodeoxyribonuclease VII small subunit [Candidatus Paenalcaligenes intestinipullorum]|uniref:Exodeoxyribonuclease 7 small subunit n=1 Tax=Candidatus Paenalcaligenes intestinipullorum TaxID=2838718 RepID=A0A9D2RKS4_9BURK|nr:exodeoxyribonuclease VII small subunit [Candidatus Paenalcaligenes intestinipullorum]